MKHVSRNIVIASVGLAIVLSGVGLTPIATSASASQPTTNATTAAAVTAIVAQPFAPLTYFETSCATCHGAYGSGYGDIFEKKLSQTELRTAIHNMAHGPGNAPIDPPQVEVLLAYHNAIIAKQPFVAVIKNESSNGTTTITGEVTPGTKVTVADTPATVDGHAWTATVPTADTYPLTASLGDQTIGRTITN